MPYTVYGPFVDGAAPGIASAFLNPLETYLASINSAATDASIQSSGGALTVLQLVANQTGTSISGSTSGTVKFFTPIWGTALKILVVLYNNYNDGSVRAFNFPSATTAGWFGTGNWGNSTDTVTFYRSASAQSVRAFTAFATAGGTVGTVTNIKQLCFGMTTAADQIQIGSTSGARTTMDWYIGA